MIQKTDLALMWGGSGCREYVYLQIKLSVLKQYLPGLFRYSSAVKPWVQLSLYCVNLPSFRPDSISFLPPPNTPIHIPIRSAKLTTQMLLLMVAKQLETNVFVRSFSETPLRRFGKNLKRDRKSKGAQGDQTKPDEKKCKDHQQIQRQDNLHDLIKGGSKNKQ